MSSFRNEIHQKREGRAGTPRYSNAKRSSRGDGPNQGNRKGVPRQQEEKSQENISGWRSAMSNTAEKYNKMRPGKMPRAEGTVMPTSTGLRWV